MKIKKLIWVLFFLFFVTSVFAKECEQVRAAFDVGSGSTKVKVARVDVCKQRILTVLLDEKKAVRYAEDLAVGRPMGRLGFSEPIMKQGIATIQALKAKADAFEPDEYRAVATASFRIADNAKAFLQTIQRETNLALHIINQEREAELGFAAAAAGVGLNPLQLVSWDIGGGSMQISMENETGFHTDLGTLASSTFKNQVLQSILKVDPLMVSTPNPLSVAQIKQARLLATEAASSVLPVVQSKIQSLQGQVIGIGGVHTGSIQRRVAPNADSYTREDLEAALAKLTGKSDVDLGGGPYVATAVTDLILVLGYMDALQINRVTTQAINLTDALLVTPIPPYLVSMALLSAPWTKVQFNESHV